MTWKDAVRRALRPIDPYHVPPIPAEVKLDANESPYPPSPELLAAIGEAIARADLHRYPDTRAGRLRALVAADLAQPGERLVFGNGSDELLALLCATFAEPREGDRAARLVYPAPSFVVYRTAASAAGMEVVEAPLGPRFEPQPAALFETVARAHPTLVFVATPNNPTGTAWAAPDLERLVAETPDAIVLIDEAYCAYGRSNHLPIFEKYKNCAILRTYSKIGLAGLRIGVLIAHPEVAHEVEKVRPPYNLGVVQQLAACVAIEKFRGELSRNVDEVVAERDRLSAAVAALPGVEVFPSSANLFVIRVAGAQRVWRGLADRSVLVRNFDRPGPLAGCLRVTVGTPDENRRFLAALTEVVAQ
jgi:histidinol-phosphate aminotransferase